MLKKASDENETLRSHVATLELAAVATPPYGGRVPEGRREVADGVEGAEFDVGEEGVHRWGVHTSEVLRSFIKPNVGSPRPFRRWSRRCRVWTLARKACVGGA